MFGAGVLFDEGATVVVVPAVGLDPQPTRFKAIVMPTHCSQIQERMRIILITFEQTGDGFPRK